MSQASYAHDGHEPLYDGGQEKADKFRSRIALRSAAEQAEAFADAHRHSRHVRFLKRAIVTGSGAIILMLGAYTIFDPFSKLPKGVAIANATLNGTRITMEQPRLSGFRKDGRPYELHARSGVQDIRKPKIIELNDIEAKIRVDAKDFVRVTAPAGVFDSGADVMQLRTTPDEDRIRIKGPTYSILLQTADVNFKSGTVNSQKPVSVKMQNGTISADTLDVIDNGKRITFTGNVRTVWQSPPDEKKPSAPDVKDAKGQQE